MKPKCLDLYCGGGGCTKGYQDAGFYVAGVDIEPQPRYCGDRFIQGDAIMTLARMVSTGEIKEYNLIHASPPCQKYTTMGNVWEGREYPDLIAITRTVIKHSGLPYVIENVVGARGWLINPIMLCGTMFNLKVYRHRLFECNPWLLMPPHILHRDKTPKAGRGTTSPKGFISVAGHFSNIEYVKKAMKIDWMVQQELAQAVPPAFTKWIGEQMIQALDLAPPSGAVQVEMF